MDVMGWSHSSMVLVLPEGDERGHGQVGVPFGGHDAGEVERDRPGLVELVAVGFEDRAQELPQPGWLG